MIFMQILFVFLLSCSGNGNSGSPDGSKQEIQKPDKEIELFIQQWKSDSLGCQKLRTKVKAETIIDSLKLESTAKAQFLKVFGNPNTENEREGNIILGYYFDALCSKGKLIDSADYCIAEFTFKQDKLLQRNYICR